MSGPNHGQTTSPLRAASRAPASALEPDGDPALPLGEDDSRRKSSRLKPVLACGSDSTQRPQPLRRVLSLLPQTFAMLARSNHGQPISLVRAAPLIALDRNLQAARREHGPTRTFSNTKRVPPRDSAQLFEAMDRSSTYPERTLKLRRGVAPHALSIDPSRPAPLSPSDIDKDGPTPRPRQTTAPRRRSL